MIHPSSHTAEIVLSDASYTIADAALLAPLTLSACEKRIGVVGRNGSGKSTLARLLCGLIEPSTGSLSVAGVDVANDRFNAIRTVGMLFQNPDHQVIFPTVEEELAFGLQQLGFSKEQVTSDVQAALQGFSVSQWSERSVSTLSQGQRHLVCLMAVLLMKPKLIVLDEPYAGLDMPTTMQLARVLDKVDASIVHVTHQLEALSAYNRIWWIDEGKLLMDAEPSVVLPAFTKHMQVLGESDALL